jgi:hypothetical protein
MTLSEERLKILQMVQEGKISAEEASMLIEAMGDTGERNSVPQDAARSGFKDARWFRVKVTDTHTGRPRVNVRIPVKLLRLGLKSGKNFTPEIEGLDMEELIKFVESGEVGTIVDVMDEEDGEHVEVTIE